MDFFFDERPVQPHLMVDGSNLAYRAYHSTPADLTAPDGSPSNAVMGFTRMLAGLMLQRGPKSVVVAWDAPGGKEERSDAWEGYKAHRDGMPDNLRAQWPALHDAVAVLGGVNWQHSKYEADDLIAAWSDHYPHSPKLILSGDKDLLSLVKESTVLRPQMGGQYLEADAEYVKKKFGITPEQVSEYLALVGDSSDGWPGIPGVGPVAAQKLLSAWGDIATMYEHIDEIMPIGVQKKLRDNAEHIKIGIDITRLRRDAVIPDIHEVSIDKDKLREFIRRWALNSLRVDELVMLYS